MVTCIYRSDKSFENQQSCLFFINDNKVTPMHYAKANEYVKDITVYLLASSFLLTDKLTCVIFLVLFPKLKLMTKMTSLIFIKQTHAAKRALFSTRPIKTVCNSSPA